MYALKKEHLDYMRDKFRGFLATVNSKLVPRIVPVCFAYTESRIYIPIDRKPKKTQILARVKDIRQNPSVSFIVDNYSDNWALLSYMLVFAKASILDGGNDFETASSLIVKRYPQYKTIGTRFYYIISLEPEHVKLWFFKRIKQETFQLPSKHQ
jgi:PPOX class probable F420-dependent enzyme